MSKLPSKEIYVVPDWMRHYMPLFNNTGGNDVEELLHDDSTTPFANVVRYMLIVSARSQFDLLVTLRKRWMEALTTLDGVSLIEVYRTAYEEVRYDGLVNWEAACSLAKENEELKRKLEVTEKRIAELEALAKSVKFDPIPMEELGNKSDGKKHPYMFGAGYNSAVVHCESVMLKAFATAGIGKGN